MRYLLSKLIITQFTHFLLKRWPLNSRKTKHEIITRNGTYELPQKLLNDLRLSNYTEDILRLFTCV